VRALHRLCKRLFNFTTRRRGDERLREEIEAHIASQTEDNIRAGMAPEDARRQARLRFGSVESVREDYRAEQGLPSVESLLLDVRHSVRSLRRSPAFAAVAALTLMLTIGANVLVFGVVKAVLLPRQDVVDPDNLYQLRASPRMSGRNVTTSYPAFEDMRQRNRTFSGMAGFWGYSAGTLTWGSAETKVRGYEASGNYFDLLGARPAIGRFFHPADLRGPGSAPYMVLSDQLWRRAFHRDADVVGRTVRLDNRQFTVIGVASQRFHGTERFDWPDYWIPLVNGHLAGGGYLDRGQRALTVIGRLEPGVTPERATADLNAIASRLADEYPKTDSRTPLRLVRAGLYGDEGDFIRASLVGVNLLALLLLLAACVNLASLFAARTADRARELAVRVALGSSRRRLIQQLLTEAVLVSLAGGGAGFLGAHLLLGAMNRRPLPLSEQRMNIDVDASVYLAGLAFIFGSALVFGMVPAWRAWQGSPLQAMKSGPVDATHRRRLGLRDVLLGAQIAICTVLVAASLAAVHSLVRALDGPIGIKPHGAMLASVELPAAARPRPGTVERAKAAIAALRSLPGVTAVGATLDTPMSNAKRAVPIHRAGTTELLPDDSVLSAMSYSTSPGYLEAAGTRLLVGRDVAWPDVTGKPSVALVNETFARAMWGDAPAIGQTFIVSERLAEVVGVVEDGKYHDPMEPQHAAVFLPLASDARADVVYVVRSRLAPDEVAAALRRTLRGLEPNASLDVRSWPDALAGHLRPARVATAALGVIGVLAALLAVTGIFGMAAYDVSRRKKELGIRTALGARRKHVMSAAVGRPAVLLGVGSAVGLLAGVFASRLLGAVVHRADPGDPAVLVGAVLTMALLGIAGSAIPAWRALAVDPSTLIRED
jgi:predicted permease